MPHFGSVIALHRIEMEGTTLHVLPSLYIQIYEWEELAAFLLLGVTRGYDNQDLEN